MARYVYPVVLTPEDEGGYSACFPDLESCYTQGEDLADALEMAADVLCMTLYGLEEAGGDFPEPTGTSALAAEGRIVSLVSADTMEYRKFYDNKAIRKTLTLPSWLNVLAEKQGINFSAALQKALREELRL